MRTNILSSIALIFLVSCAPTFKGEVKDKSDLKLPKDFLLLSKDKDGVTSTKNWHEYFKDEKLRSLIELGLKNNQEINILAQEISISQNEVMARQGEYLPNLSFRAGYESERVGEFTSQGVSDATHTLEDGKPIPKTLHNHRVGLAASWELDVWAKLRNASEAAYYRALASKEAQKLAVTHYVAEVANSYYELLALDREKDLIDSYIGVLKQAKELVEAQQNAARVTSLAVKRFQAEVLKNESKKFEIKQRTVMLENKINRLLGRFPQEIERTSILLEEISPQSVKLGIPADLLENRPDIKKATYELEAAKLDVKSTKARFYPSLSIEAEAGYEAFNREHLYDRPESIFTNLAVNLTAPLLNRAAIKADYFSANNMQLQAIYEYEKSLLYAYAEVTNQISKINNLETIYELKKEQVKVMDDSVEISGILFKAARVDYVEALLTQRESLESKLELVEVKRDQLMSYIDLYRSLGGGWQLTSHQHLVFR